MISVYDFNAYGRSHKSIGVDEIIDDALANNVGTIAVISSGNYIHTILYNVEQRGLRDKLDVVNLVRSPKGSRCVEIPIGLNRVLKNAEEREKYVRERLPGAGKVRDYTDFQPQAYGGEAEKILSSNPDYVSVGVGSGKFFLALYEQIKKAGLDTQLIGVLPKGENGVFNGENLFERDGSLFYRKFKGKSIADKLACPYTSFKSDILEAQSEGHVLVEATNWQLRRANKKARKLGYDAEPSGSAGFVVYNPKIRRKLGISDDAGIVIINTGRGFDWEEMLRREKLKRRVGYSTVIATVATLGIALFLNRSPSSELMAYADLDGNGVVSSEEVVECHGIAGNFLNEDYSENIKKRRDIGSNPRIDRKTLREIKKLRDKSFSEVVKRYDSKLGYVSHIVGRDVGNLGDLSFDELNYLVAYDDFTKGDGEILRAMMWQDLVKKGRIEV